MKSASSVVRSSIYVLFFLAAVSLIYVKYRHSEGAADALPDYGEVPAFSLTTERKSAYSQKDLLGKVTVADFIFTTCAGPCPLMSGTMQHLQSTFAGEPRIRFLSVSVDPETDTPEVLAEYGRRFGADSSRWTFLTGEKRVIYILTQKGFHLSVDADSDAILHSTKFVLVDKAARIRGYYDSEDDSSLTLLRRDAVALAKD